MTARSSDRQAVQPRGQQRLDRWRDRDLAEAGHRDPAIAAALEEAPVDEHRNHLFDEQRVAFGRAADALGQIVAELDLPEDVGDRARGSRSRSAPRA